MVNENKRFSFENFRHKEIQNSLGFHMKWFTRKLYLVEGVCEQYNLLFRETNRGWILTNFPRIRGLRHFWRKLERSLPIVKLVHHTHTLRNFPCARKLCFLLETAISNWILESTIKPKNTRDRNLNLPPTDTRVRTRNHWRNLLKFNFNQKQRRKPNGAFDFKSAASEELRAIDKRAELRRLSIARWFLGSKISENQRNNWKSSVIFVHSRYVSW